MRVYCGLASAGEQLTAAVVDDGGQVAALAQVGDNPEGYAELLSLLASRADPAGIMYVPVSTDSPDRRVPQLLVASGRVACFVDQDTVERLAAAEPADAADDARRAVAMARALYNGTLTAVAQPPLPALTPLRPVLWAHVALTVSRVGAVAALREVLRELYPAALRAFPDPGAATPLALLDALPDPLQVARGQDENVVARLTTAGLKDPGQALSALRQAVADQPASGSVMESAGATVRQTVAAVLACDTAAGTLVREIAERLEHPTDGEPVAGPTPPAAPSGWSARTATAPDPFGRPPLAGPGAWPPRPTADADQSAGVAPLLPSRANRSTSAPPLLPSRADQSARRGPSPATRRSARGAGTGRQAPGGTDLSDQTLRLRAAPAPETTPPSTPPPPPEQEAPADERTAERPTLPGEPEPPTLDMPTDFQPTVLLNDTQEPAPDPTPPRTLRSVTADGEERAASVTPLPALDQTARSRRGESGPRRRRSRASGHELSLRPEPKPEPAAEPPVAEADPELLIFAAARSAWFAGEHGTMEWDSSADEGWRAAEAASRPSVGTSTESGLPRRVPQANLVPGSSPADEQHQEPITRDASQLAAQTAGYFHGWRRGRQSTGHESGQQSPSEAFSPAARQ